MAVPQAVPLTGTKTFTTGFEGRVLRSGEYRCGHTNVNLGGERHVPYVSLTITRHGAYCKHGRNGKTLLDTQRVAFFNPGETYRSSHPLGCGDHGEFLDVRQDVVDDVVLALEPSLRDRSTGPFPWDDGPLAPAAALELERLIAAQNAPKDVDALELEERWLALFERFVADAVAARERRPHAPSRRRFSPHGVGDAVLAARALVATRCTESSSLTELAAAVGSSPFHLSRSFRALVGVPLFRYREHCRLRLALERLRAGARDLTQLALELGFSSHSHFTHRFRAVFGLTPTQLRAMF
ncbi:MAG: helix-turn-helix transcriptional regulator [Planctomycetes bacterium]|nr:helix-turn-helix transcriptional regulator [Planctomycetota bacterium]